MAEDTPESSPEEDDVEAEMLRMMQEEIAGEGGGEEGDGGEEEDAFAAMATALGGADEGEGGADGGNIDAMLEDEMLKAMQSDTDAASTVGGAMAPIGAMPIGLEDPEGIQRLIDVEVNVTVEIGGTVLAIKDILAWTRDSIVELEPLENEPVEVMVNGKLFARGEVVVVEDTFGVRIIELIDQSEEPHL